MGTMGQLGTALHPLLLMPTLEKMREMLEDRTELGSGARRGEWQGEASYK